MKYRDDQRRGYDRRRGDYGAADKIARVYFCVSTFVAAIISLNDHDSLGWMLVNEVGWPARYIMMVLIVLTGIGIADVIVNDFMPRRFHLTWSARYRDIGYLIMASVYATFVFMAVQRNHLSLLLIRYLVDCIACTYIAIADVRVRFLEPRKRRRASELQDEEDARWASR